MVATLVLLAATSAVASIAQPSPEPITTTISEVERVGRTQVELTTWKSAPDESCPEVSPGKLKVEVDKEEVGVREVSWLDPVGVNGPPQSTLIVIDLRFMGKMMCSICQPCDQATLYTGARRRAEEWINKFLQESEFDQDHLVSILTLPRLSTQSLVWMHPYAAKFQWQETNALIRNRSFQVALVTNGTTKPDPKTFWPDLRGLLEDLPELNNRVDMVFIAADIPDLRDYEARELGELARQKHVVIYPKYVLETVAKQPEGLGLLAEITGGRLFRNNTESLSDVVSQIRFVACRYAVALDQIEHVKKGKLTVESLTGISFDVPAYVRPK